MAHRRSRKTASVPTGLEALDLDVSLGREEYDAVFPELQERLRRLQYRMQMEEVPVVLVLEGIVGAGRGKILRKLAQRLDPRLLHVHPNIPPGEEARKRHFLWRFQRQLPADGHMTVFDGSWYERVLIEHIEGSVGRKGFRRACREIAEFERWLVDDGQVVVKVWLHVSAKTQRRRLRKREANPLTGWLVTGGDWRQHARHDDWCETLDRVMKATSLPGAPWTPVAATSGRHARVEVFRLLIDRFEAALEARRLDPERVSRSAAAERARAAADELRRMDEALRARRVAAEAGLPLEEESEGDPGRAALPAGTVHDIEPDDEGSDGEAPDKEDGA